MLESPLQSDGSAARSKIPGVPEDRLQAQLRSLIEKLHARTEAVPDVFRQFCLLARAHELNPEEFRAWLVRARLAYSRASELKTVLQSPHHCTAFLKPPGEAGRQSWQQTLQAARRERLASETNQTREQLLAARLAGRLFRSGQTVLPLAGGLLVPEPRAGDLEALS